jgi:transcriptional regulator with XRE-family HTH domain
MQRPEPNSLRLGAKLRDLRVRQGLSVRTFAAQVGFSPSFISQLEADLVSPSINSLEKIAGGLGITLGQLFSSLEQDTPARIVVRYDERPTFVSTWSNSKVSILADPSPDRKLSAMEIIIGPGGMSSRKPEARPHDTIALLRAGTLVLSSRFGEEMLAPGDTAYFAAGTPFAWANRSDSDATLVLVGITGRADLARDIVASPSEADSDTLT